MEEQVPKYHVRLFNLVTIVLIVLSAFSARAQTQTPKLSPGENILVPTISGWKLDWGKKTSRFQTTEFVPKSESVKNWTQLLTVQIIYGQNRLNPATFSSNMAARFQKGCTEVEANTTPISVHNGYPTAELTLVCARELKSGKGSVTMMRSFAGRDSFYIVQRAWRGAPFPLERSPLSQDTTDDWRAFLNSVRECDTRRESNPCNLNCCTRILPPENR